MIASIVVLDYSCCEVFAYTNVEIKEHDQLEESELIEEWLTEKHHLSNCSWMSSDDKIKINVC